MAGMLEFLKRFGTEEACIDHLSTLRWPGGYVCPRCGGRAAWRLPSRPRTFECAGCHHQESVTAGTIFHRTRTPLPSWFLAAYLMGADKRGVSAKFLQRQLGVAYQTAWTIAHKLRHGLNEDQARPDKSLVVAAIEKVPAPKTNGKHGHALKRQHGFHAGAAWISVLPAATGEELGRFLKSNIQARSYLLTDGFSGYQGKDAALGDHLKHTPIVQGDGANAAGFFPIVQTIFSNIKAWLVGIHHGVSAKHLPRYLREWAYRLSRRNLSGGPALRLIRRAVECATITYDQIVHRAMVGGATHTPRRSAVELMPALADRETFRHYSGIHSCIPGYHRNAEVVNVSCCSPCS